MYEGSVTIPMIMSTFSAAVNTFSKNPHDQGVNYGDALHRKSESPADWVQFLVAQKPVPVSGMRLLLPRSPQELPEFGGDVAADASGLVHAGAGVPFDEDFGHLCRCVAVDPG